MASKLLPTEPSPSKLVTQESSNQGSMDHFNFSSLTFSKSIVLIGEYRLYPLGCFKAWVIFAWTSLSLNGGRYVQFLALTSSAKSEIPCPRNQHAYLYRASSRFPSGIPGP